MRGFFPILVTMLWMVLAGNSQASEVAFGYTDHASNLIGSVTVVDARDRGCLPALHRARRPLPSRCRFSGSARDASRVFAKSIGFWEPPDCLSKPMYWSWAMTQPNVISWQACCICVGKEKYPF